MWGKKAKDGAELVEDRPAPRQAPAPTARGNAEPPVSTTNGLLALGQIVSVLMASARFARVPLGRLRAFVLPAIRTGQYVLATAQATANGPTAPVGVALWASVSDEVDRRLSAQLDRPAQLTPEEWQSGPHAWLVTIAGDRCALNPMIEQLRTSVLKDRPLKARVMGKDGKSIVTMFSAATSGLQPLIH